MTERLAGISLPTGDDYDPYHGALGVNFINMADDLADTQAIWDAGMLPIPNMMYHLERQPGCNIHKIANEEYAHLEENWLMELAGYCAAGGKAIVAYLPEMNGNWCPAYATDQYSTTAFKTAYRNFVDRGRAMGLDETMVKWMWAPNDHGWEDLETWYPGDGWVDFIGGSAYCWGGFEPVFTEPWKSPADLFDPYVLEVRGFTDLPIIITQTGAGKGDSRSPGWLSDLAFYTDTYQNIEGFVYYDQLWFEYEPGVHDYNDRVEDCSAERPLHWFEKEEEIVPTQHPDAIQVIPCNDARPGKNWVGGSGKRKLLLHTIEGADEDIGWPRDWTRWCATPHLAMHPWKYGRGEDEGLYQLVGFDKAAYSLRDNAGEDDRYIWQVELAGRAANVPIYDDDWYRGVAKLCSWFIENMGVADVFADFDNPVRMGSAGWNAFSGIMGHVHFGAGVDDHTDPGHLDVARVRSFMEEDLMDYGRYEAYVKQDDTGFAVEEAQVKIIMAVLSIPYSGNSNRQFVESNAPGLTFKEWDQALTDYFSAWTGRNSYGYGPTEKLMVEEAIRNL